MQKSRLLGAVCTTVFGFISMSSHATLIDNGGGLIYDDVLLITWSQPDVQRTWNDANTWAGGLTLGGATEWRQPYISVIEGAGPFTGSPVNCNTATELACRDNELGYMFYHNLSGTNGSSILTSGDPDLGLFPLLQSDYYWSGTDYGSFGFAWVLNFNIGDHGFGNFPGNDNYTWAVHAGNVGAAVVPDNYTLIDLGTFEILTFGGTHSYASAINESRQVVGSSNYIDDVIPPHAFLYEGGPLQDIDTLDSTQSWATDINESGQIVGLVSTPNANGQRPFLYDNGIMQALGTFLGGNSIANGINDSGQIVGMSATTDGGYHAFLYEDGIMQELGTLGGTRSNAYSINNSGQAVGTSSIIYDIATHAVLFEGGSIQDLDTLGGKNSSASDINESGHIVGHSDLMGDTARHAFLYQDGIMQDLGTLGTTHSSASGINNQGQIVGHNYNSGSGSSTSHNAFIYTGGVMRDLCVVTDCVSAGWDKLRGAADINDNGDIVGVGDIGGEEHAFLALRSDAIPAPLDIEKLTNGNQADGANDSDVPRIAPGETVSWTYLVTNKGVVDVSEAEIIVTDNQLGITPVLDIASDAGSDSILSAGETWTYTASAQALDLETPPAGVTVVPGCNDERNTYQNTGRVEIIGSNISDEDLSHYCNYGRTEINIRKQTEGPDSRTFLTGSDVSFEIEVTNTGEVDLDNVVVTDETAPDCTKDIGFLGIGLTETYECTISGVTSSLVNEACVSVESSEGVPVEKCDTSSVEIIGIDIRKQEEGADTRNFPYASNVPFEIVVTNTSGEDLENVIVSDPLAPDCDYNIGDLAAGDSVTYPCTQSAVILNFTNEACVSADRNGVAVGDCDPSTVELIINNLVTGDTWVNAAKTNNNYGTAPRVQVRENEKRISLGKFDVTPLAGLTSSAITSAILKLKINNVGVPGKVNVHQIIGPWSEGSVTHNTLPAYNSPPAASANITKADIGTIVSIDITDIVKSWADSPSEAYGIALVSPDARIWFDAKEMGGGTPMSIRITTGSGTNQTPMADAGADQDVATGSLVTLNGSGSSDPDAGPSPLAYAWSLDTVPLGSTATLSDPTAASPTFTADLDGTYTASLVVNDGADDSAPDSVSVTATTAAVGNFDDGQTYYEFSCSGCHAAGTYDTTATFGDIAGAGNLLVNDLGTLNAAMAGITLTDQEILDLQAFLDDPSIMGGPANKLLVTGDTWVNAGKPTRNFGTAKRIQVRENAKRISLGQFDIASLAGLNSSSITSAILELKINNVGVPGQVNVHQINGPWTEGSVTYNTLPAYSSPAATANITAADTGSVVSFDITEIVRAWADSPYAAQGVALISPDARIYFDTKETNGGTPMYIEFTTGSATNQAPLADAGGPYSVVIGNAINFDGSASYDPEANPLTYSWDFGDGSAPGIGASPSHVYGAADTYTVTLTVNDGVLNSTPATTTAVVTIVSTVNQAPVTGDTWVNAEKPTSNFGSATRSQVRENGKRIALSQFDVSALAGLTSSAISSAILKFRMNNVGVAGQLGVHQVNGPWVENSVTYGTLPAYSATPAATANYTSADIGTVGSLDITDIVKSWADNPSDAHGIALLSPNARIYFDTKETGGGTPMVIEFTTGP